VENFKTGTMEKWGPGFDMLHAKFPRLVHCRVSGFGTVYPRGGQPGYDAAIQALVSLMSVNGDADRPGPRRDVPVVDIVTDLNAALGVMLALKERERNGQGQFIEAALFDCGLSPPHPHSANHLLDPRCTRGRCGNAHPNIVPYDTFATGGNTPVFLAVCNDGQFAQLCECTGASALREQRRNELKRLLGASLAAFTDCEALADCLVRAGVPRVPILDVPAALANPHTKH
jgi:crotonobetainyl-CoA:carnitine CoA-transferase CaiB-like acyl-CoA transferase